MNEITKTEMQKNKIYLLPFCILIFAPLAGLKPFAAMATQAEATRAMVALAAENDPRMMIIRGIAYLIALVLFVKRLPGSMHLLLRQLSYLMLGVFTFTSIFWSSYPLKVFINFGHLMGAGLVLLALVWYFETRSEYVFHFFAKIVGVFLLLSIPAILFLPAGVGLDGRWYGVAGNSNTLGMLCVISTWANTASLFCVRERNLRLWNWCLLWVTIVMLLGSGSATSIINSMFIVAGLVFLKSLEGNRRPIRLIKIFFFLCLMIVTFLTVFIVVPDILEAKGFFGLFGRSATLSGRTKLWAEAWQLIEARPWLGWSFDSNMSVLKSLGKVGQFHNGYLDLMVRGGVVGGVLFISLVIATAHRILVVSRVNYRQAIVYAMLVAAILLHNVTEASFVRETHLLWVLLLFVYFYLGSTSFSSSVQLDRGRQYH